MMRGLWTRETVAILMLAAYLPIALAWSWQGGDVARLTLAALIVAGWQFVFMLVRAQVLSLSGVVTALAVALFAPADLSLFQLLLGLSLGVVMGELVFGGWGRNVVHPATVSLAFLGFAFPALTWPSFDAPVAWAAIAAVLIGGGLGILPVLVLLSAGIVGGVAIMGGLLSEPQVFAAALVLVVLVADPVTSAATGAGRVLYGALYAALVVLFTLGWAGAAPVQVAVAAALLASLAAPVLDEASLAIWVARRRKRHGRT